VNAEEFNARYPIGTPVVAYPGIRPEHPVAVAYRKAVEAGRTVFGETNPCKRLETVTRTRAWTLGHGAPVVSVEGYGGGIALTHVDIAPRTNTPDEKTVNEHGRTVTTMKLKRCCNGCGQYVGDADNRDVDEHGNLTDVRHECPNCSPVVELEAAGCRTWQLTPRNYNRIAHQIDQLGVFTKDFTEDGPDGRLTVVGLRIGTKPGHVVARFGDWIIRHPDRSFTIHKAPEQVAS
jgi:hypothetical protein